MTHASWNRNYPTTDMTTSKETYNREISRKRGPEAAMKRTVFSFMALQGWALQ